MTQTTEQASLLQFWVFFRACLHGDGGLQMGWGNPPSRGRKIKHVYIQSHSPGVLGWGFLRFFVGLAIKEFEQGRPKLTSRERRKINSRTHIYSWKRHALFYAVLGYARNRWLHTLYGIVWETKYGRFTTLNIPKCEHFTLLLCPLRFLAGP